MQSIPKEGYFFEELFDLFENTIKGGKNLAREDTWLLFIYWICIKCTKILCKIYLNVAQFFAKFILSVAQIFTISILSVAIFFVKAILSVGKLFTKLILISS